MAGEDGRVAALHFADGAALAVDLVVFSAGIRPRDRTRRASAALRWASAAAWWSTAPACTSDPHIYAVGECALAEGRIWGLVAPGYDMARVVADRLLGGDSTFVGGDLSTKLKLMGVDVASFGDAFAASPTGPGRSRSTIPSRRSTSAWSWMRLANECSAGVFVGDASAYHLLVQMARGDMPTPEHPEQLIFPAGDAAAATVGVAALSASASVCSCNNVSKEDICSAINRGGLSELGQVKAAPAPARAAADAFHW